MQLLLHLVVILSPGLVQAQQSDLRPDSQSKTVSYGFVSPNTEVDLSLNEAIDKLASQQEKDLIHETRRVACQSRIKIVVMRALGSGSDGPEHSIVFKTRADTSTVRYAVASLGKYARQTAVLYFRNNPNGKARLYILVPHLKNLVVLSRVLDLAGVAFRTLVPLKRRTLIYVVDMNGELRRKFLQAAEDLKARVRVLQGDAGLIGDDADREKSNELFDAEIKAYRSNHPEPLRRCMAL